MGHEVTLLSAVMLNLGQLLGSGIFSVPGVVLNSVGSIGLSLSFWAATPMLALGTTIASKLPLRVLFVDPLFCLVALLSYTELASFFPGRSGAEVVFLEQAYPRPRFLVPTTFAMIAVLLSCVYSFGCYARPRNVHSLLVLVPLIQSYLHNIRSHYSTYQSQTILKPWYRLA